MSAPDNPVRFIDAFVDELLYALIVLGHDRSTLRGVLSQYFQYHHTARTHLSLNKDCPQPRRIQSPSAGKIVAFPEVGGLHHRYERRAACLRTTMQLLPDLLVTGATPVKLRKAA